MRRTGLGLRTIMAAVGAITLATYTAVAYLLYAAAEFVRVNRPDPVTFGVLLLTATAVSGYLTYRAGTERALVGLDARPLPRERAPGIHRVRDRLAETMGIPAPALYVVRLGEPNALALGGGRPALVLDYTLFGLLDPAEMEGVLAHELAHVEGRDGLTQTLAYSLVGTVVGSVALVLTPLTVEVTGRPLALARALRKIDGASGGVPLPPLYRLPREGREREHPLVRLLSTHPPMDERIDRLRARAATAERERASRWTRIPIERERWRR